MFLKRLSGTKSVMPYIAIKAYSKDDETKKKVVDKIMRFFEILRMFRESNIHFHGTYSQLDLKSMQKPVDKMESIIKI